MCWDSVCTVAEVWCCSENYLWLFDGGFLLEAILQCVVIVRSFLRLLKLRKLAVSRGGLTQCHGVIKLTPEYPFKRPIAVWSVWFQDGSVVVAGAQRLLFSCFWWIDPLNVSENFPRWRFRVTKRSLFMFRDTHMLCVDARPPTHTHLESVGLAAVFVYSR